PGPGDAVHLPHEDRHPRHRRLVARVHRADASTDRVRALSLGADHEARLVHHVHDGQVELVAQVDHAHELVRCVAGQAARVVVGIGGEDANGPALEPRKRRDQRAAVTGSQLEHGAAVEHEVEDATNICAVPRTITEKWEAATRAAPSPATGPSAAATTGTAERFATTSSQPGTNGT